MRNLFLLLLFATLILLSMADTAISFALFKRLKTQHHAKYEALDRPAIFFGGWTSAWALVGFLVFRDHTLLKDRTTTRLADALLVLRAVTVFAFVAMMILAAGALHSA